jgi:hypothetical protein
MTVSFVSVNRHSFNFGKYWQAMNRLVRRLSVAFKKFETTEFQTLPMAESVVPGHSAIATTRARYRTNHCVKNGKWQKEEDELLMQIMSSPDRPNYARLAETFPGKTGQQVAERWDKVLNPALQKGSWTRAEDEIIISYVEKNGTKKWQKLCALLPGRIGKQCRERWRNHLDPSLNHAQWTDAEDDKLIDLHRQYGNAWVTIALVMQNRSDNDVKNRWNATLRKQEAVLESRRPIAAAPGEAPGGTSRRGKMEAPELEDGRAGPQSSPLMRIPPLLRVYSPIVQLSGPEIETCSLADNRVALKRLLLAV